MTTTGFTMWYKYLQIIKPEILIIEEASEIEEWNMAALLQPYVKHIIQIGDYKQLSPLQTNSKFCQKNNIQISQFQRLLERFQLEISTKLQYQRRMIPLLSQFPRIVYGQNYYQDHQNAQQLVQESMMDKKLIFINHSFAERGGNVQSCYNVFEAHMCVYYAHYLNMNYNIPKHQITILCMYKDQVKYIQEYRKEFNEQNQVLVFDSESQNEQIQTVDEYQGKENNYIILSCVRSNTKNQIGFLNENNRINVAFSRAKLGLIVIGAFWMFNNKQLLYQFIDLAQTQNLFIDDKEDLPNEIKQFYNENFDKQSNYVCQIDQSHPAHIGTCKFNQNIRNLQQFNYQNIQDQPIQNESEKLKQENKQNDVQNEEDNNNRRHYKKIQKYPIWHHDESEEEDAYEEEEEEKQQHDQISEQQKNKQQNNKKFKKAKNNAKNKQKKLNNQNKKDQKLELELQKEAIHEYNNANNSNINKDTNINKDNNQQSNIELKIDFIEKNLLKKEKKKNRKKNKKLKKQNIENNENLTQNEQQIQDIKEEINSILKNQNEKCLTINKISQPTVRSDAQINLNKQSQLNQTPIINHNYNESEKAFRLFPQLQSQYQNPSLQQKKDLINQQNQMINNNLESKLYNITQNQMQGDIQLNEQQQQCHVNKFIKIYNSILYKSQIYYDQANKTNKKQIIQYERKDQIVSSNQIVKENDKFEQMLIEISNQIYYNIPNQNSQQKQICENIPSAILLQDKDKNKVQKEQQQKQQVPLPNSCKLENNDDQIIIQRHQNQFILQQWQLYQQTTQKASKKQQDIYVRKDSIL